MKLVKISDVKSNPKNPRVIKDNKFQKLVKSIQEFPDMLNKRPLIVFTDVDGKYCVLGGNMRLKALNELKFKEIPVIVADEWTEEQKHEFLIKDNVGFGEWDWDSLANEWDVEKLDDWGLDLPVDLSVSEELEAEEDNYEIPNEINTDIVLGDLFEIGEHRLLCGDSTDSDQVARLMNGEKADMVFTSPPYNANTSFNAGRGGSGFGGGKNLGKLYESYSDNLEEKEYIDFCVSVINNCFLNTYGFIFWNVNYNTNSRSAFLKQIYPFLDNLTETIIWKKQALPVPYGLTRIYEYIFVFATNGIEERLGNANKTEFNFWDINNSNSLDKTHRAAYPIKLVEKGFDLTNANLVLDTFLGSGSTMVASHQLKRKCYGMELDPKYCQVIIDRMKKLDPTLVIKKNGVEIK